MCREKEQIRCWTLQPMSVWQKLKQDRRLYVDRSINDHNDCGAKCDWLRDQMKIRIPDYHSNHPWCGWLYGYGRTRNHIGREQCHREQLVKIDLTLDRRLALVFPVNALLMVENNGYIGFSRSDYERWTRQLEEAGIDDTSWPLPEPFYSTVVKSWERIFDLEPLETGGEWAVRHLYVVFEELSLANVSKATVY